METRNPADVPLEQIQRRAYEIYLQRGDAQGDALEDWLAAEREITELQTAEQLRPAPIPAAAQRPETQERKAPTKPDVRSKVTAD